MSIATRIARLRLPGWRVCLLRLSRLPLRRLARLRGIAVRRRLTVLTGLPIRSLSVATLTVHRSRHWRARLIPGGLLPRRLAALLTCRELLLSLLQTLRSGRELRSEIAGNVVRLTGTRRRVLSLLSSLSERVGSLLTGSSSVAGVASLQCLLSLLLSFLSLSSRLPCLIGLLRLLIEVERCCSELLRKIIQLALQILSLIAEPPLLISLSRRSRHWVGGELLQLIGHLLLLSSEFAGSFRQSRSRLTQRFAGLLSRACCLLGVIGCRLKLTVARLLLSLLASIRCLSRGLSGGRISTALLLGLLSDRCRFRSEIGLPFSEFASRRSIVVRLRLRVSSVRLLCVSGCRLLTGHRLPACIRHRLSGVLRSACLRGAIHWLGV